MSPAKSAGDARHEGFPRVSGDEPLNSPLTVGVAEFSPRERG